MRTAPEWSLPSKCSRRASFAPAPTWRAWSTAWRRPRDEWSAPVSNKQCKRNSVEKRRDDSRQASRTRLSYAACKASSTSASSERKSSPAATGAGASSARVHWRKTSATTSMPAGLL
eukprot:7521380-Alexandrium_andersonii.AAC.1